MGMNKELVLVSERHICLAAGQKIIQCEMEAQDVSAFVDITPVMRVKLNTLTPSVPGQSGSSYSLGSSGFQVGFLGASHVGYRDESNLAGSRWSALTDIGKITSSNAGTGGVTFGTGTGGAGLPPLAKLSANPGWILATFQNLEVSTSHSLIIEVILICRGY